MTNKRLWVGGLNADVKEIDIIELFAPFGKAENIQIRYAQRDVFAFLDLLKNSEDEGSPDADLITDTMKALNNTEFKGRTIKVDFARERRDKDAVKETGRVREERGRSWERRPQEPVRHRDNNVELRPRIAGRSRSREPIRSRFDRNEHAVAPQNRNNRGFDSNRRDVVPNRDIRRSPPRRMDDEIPRPFAHKASAKETRIRVENLPEDMDWKELKVMAENLLGDGAVDFARCKEGVGLVEVKTDRDATKLKTGLDGKRVQGCGQRLIVTITRD